MAKAKGKAKPATRAAKKVAQKRAARESAREIGLPPKPAADALARRERCRDSLREFCLTFLPAKFFLAFSPDHLRVIARLETIVREGGLFALAMPRGNGKTELVKAAALWAILYGYRRFVAIIGATAADAVRIAADLKSTLEHNDELDAAFPEATFPVREMGGVSAVARFQTIEGRSSGLEWKRESVRLAWVPGAACSGAIIRTAGLTGSIRGMTATGPGGETIRPDLALCDDPQTRESADSRAQTEDRERIIRGDVLGLAGPTRTIACAMPCTVIAENDLADRHLDRERNPQWSGERCRLVEEFPTSTALWDTYFEIRANDLRAGGTGKPATEFYLANRAEMDAGARLPWPERFDADRYASALEEAMIRQHDDPEAFAAELQNKPLRPSEEDGITRLDAAEVAKRVNNTPRGTVPPECVKLTAMIDCGASLLHYAVIGWADQFAGSIIDYGTFPAQALRYYRASEARPSLSDRFPGLPEEARVFAGLKELVPLLVGRPFAREGGGELPVEKCLIDSAKWTKTVTDFCRRSPFAALLLPSRGYGLTPGKPPMAGWTVKQGELPGHHWRRRPNTEGGHGQLLLIDTNYWKSFVAGALQSADVGPCRLHLFGDDPAAHRLLADHCTAETSVRVRPEAGDRRPVDVWTIRPEKPDNHWWDCLVGATAAASVAGLSWDSGASVGTPAPPKVKAPKVKLSDIYYAKHGGRR